MVSFLVDHVLILDSPTLFMLLGQLRGIGVISPIYYFLYYIFTPVENFKSSDMRLGRMNYAMVLLPTLVLTYYIPLSAMLYWPTLSGRESWLFLWQMFPVWIFLTTRLFSSLLKDTTITDRFEAPNRDMPVIRYTIGSLVTVSSAMWVFTCIRAISQLSLYSVFVPYALPSQTGNLATFTREFLKFDEIFLFGNTFLWLGMLFWDLKYAGMLRVGWMKLVVYLVVLVLIVGPGATAGLIWLWRENVLASKRHKDAIVEGKTEEPQKGFREEKVI